MPKYTLHYFPGRARAEIARLIFAVAGVEYEDHRIEKADWCSTWKPKFPFGQLPVLEVDGVYLNQSKTIAAYLAREFGVAGTTNLEQAQCQALSETVDDMITGLYDIMFMQDEAEKAKKALEFRNGRLKNFMELFDAYYSKQIGAEGFLVGNKMTYGDLVMFDIWDRLCQIPMLDLAPLLAEHARVTAHRDKIAALPAVKAWLDKRPQTVF